MNASSLQIMLRALRLPSVLANYQALAVTAASNNWGFDQYLHTLLEVETEDRARRRTVRLLKQSGLPDGKTLDALDMAVFPQKVRRTVPTLLDGGFVERAENVLAFGLPGRGKTHLLAGVAHELIVRHSYRVLFTTTFSLVQRLLVAKGELRIEEMFRKLDRYDVILLDDIGYVQQSREEMEILFTFLSERYERRSMMITSNLMFSEWDKIFKDPMTTLAAIDRLVHHSTVLELDCESYRANQALLRQKGGK
ncbi:MAG: IS21-like element helper ATPase IstB [Lentisphaeria bacterium]|nr:IS21-like element helper ATPase IstB [Lentisphaeria bacterium]